MRYTFVAPAEITVEANSKGDAVDEFIWDCEQGVYDTEEVSCDYSVRVPEPRRFLLVRVGEANVNEEINHP